MYPKDYSTMSSNVILYSWTVVRFFIHSCVKKSITRKALFWCCCVNTREEKKKDCILQSTCENSVAEAHEMDILYQWHLYHFRRSLQFSVYSTPPKQPEYLFRASVCVFQIEYENLEWEPGHSEVKGMFSTECIEARISYRGDSITVWQFTTS